MNNITAFAIVAVSAVSHAAEVSISQKSLDEKIGRIAKHAQFFPPQFGSQEERKQIEAELKQVLVFLDLALEQHPNETSLIYSHAFGNMMGHHLDFAGCDQKAIASFEAFLKLRPESKGGNYFYGSFLAATATLNQQAIPYLKKAVTLGAPDAHLPLAKVYLITSDISNAKLHLKKYLEAFPNDERTKKFLAMVESPNFKVQRKEGSPPGFDGAASNEAQIKNKK
ncbi:MAG: hypothetical protein JNK23_13555 [Opitutaceae bacterium]|nr:hypothetical protein [Opitutaceae bacterium]